MNEINTSFLPDTEFCWAWVKRIQLSLPSVGQIRNRDRFRLSKRTFNWNAFFVRPAAAPYNSWATSSKMDATT